MKLIQLHVLVNHKTSHDSNIKEQGWKLIWLLSWTSCFTQLTVGALSWITHAEVRNTIRQNHIKYLTMASHLSLISQPQSLLALGDTY